MFEVIEQKRFMNFNQISIVKVFYACAFCLLLWSLSYSFSFFMCWNLSRCYEFSL